MSPIYGAVLESRRIFARIKSYVVYRIAASLILVMTLSSVIFASGCAVDSLLVIILALLNDISMIPVAYDNAEATAKPQLPHAGKLVMMSLYFGVSHTALALMFIFLLDHSKGLTYDIDLATCNTETRGFIWLYLVLVTELMIFSARAPNYFFQSMPSLILAGSVLLTCVAGFLISALASDLNWENVAWIVLYNFAAFIVVDVVKVYFKSMIGESTGEIIETDELVQVDKAKTDTKKKVEKDIRYTVHRDSVLSPSDLNHSVEIVRTGSFGSTIRQFGELRNVEITDGYINKRGRARGLSNASTAFAPIAE